MIKAILFDLDDTLLDLNLSAFLGKYIAAKAALLSRVTRKAYPAVLYHTTKSYMALEAPNREDGLLNSELLLQELERRLKLPLNFDELNDALKVFDTSYIQRFSEGLVSPIPKEGAIKAVKCAQALGLQTVLATNPTFTLDCDLVRMSWAKLDPSLFSYITTIDNSSFCKPDSRYYLELLNKLKLKPEECLMVGNDASRDICRPDIGLKTIYVGHAWPKNAFIKVPMAELADKLPQIIAGLNADLQK